MKPIVNEDKCTGCGNCSDLCPAVFRIDVKTGKSVVYDPEGCEYMECCEAAEENCPEEAITLLD